MSPEAAGGTARRRTRLASAAVDGLVAGNIYLLLILALVVGGLGIREFKAVADAVVALTILVLPLAYFLWATAWVLYGIATELLFGATLGKSLTGTRVVREGGKPRAVRLVARNLVRYIDLLAFGAVGFLSLLLTRRTLGDWISGVTVEER
jgi:uncharacterized RDD family membrane protein YckC